MARKKPVEAAVQGGEVVEASFSPAEAVATAVMATAPGSAVDRAALEAEALEAKDVLALVKDFQIVLQGDMDFADECLREIKAKLKAYKAKKEEVSKPLNAALKALRGWFSPVEDFYGEAAELWERKMVAWKLAEDERQKLALQAVQIAHAAGDVQAVAEAMSVAAAATVEVPRTQTIKIVWRFAVDQPDLVPREFCAPDPKRIAPVVEALGKAHNIPGVRVWKDGDVTTRQK